MGTRTSARPARSNAGPSAGARRTADLILGSRTSAQSVTPGGASLLRPPQTQGSARLFATIRSELGEIGLAADQDESRVASSRHADDTNPRRVDHPPEDGMRDHGVEHSLDVARSAEELGVGSIHARVLEVVAWVHGRRDDEAVPGQIDCRVVMTEVGPAGAVRDHDEWVSTRLRLAIDRHIEVEWPQFDER